MKKCGENIFLILTSFAYSLWVWRVIITSDHTLAHTLRRYPLDGESASRRDLYLTTHMSTDRHALAGLEKKITRNCTQYCFTWSFYLLYM